jgi:ParB family chromosome partitioning protein
MSKFGLGKGLAELKADMGNVPDISVLTGTERVAVRQVPLIQIGANPDQPRKTFNDSELAELADSIREKGVLQPILLRSVSGRAHQYEIVAGERRFRASKLAGLAEIPALVKTITDNSAMEIALIENVQRENLNPIEESGAYKNLMTKIGYEIADVSRLIGKSESYIRNMLRLDGLPASVKKMVETGAISASHARTIAVSDDPESIAREIIDKKLSFEETGQIIKRSKKAGVFDKKDKKSRLFLDKSAQSREILATAQKISKKTGFSVKIRERKGGAGDIILSFSTRVQMNELVDKLLKI